MIEKRIDQTPVDDNAKGLLEVALRRSVTKEEWPLARQVLRALLAGKRTVAIPGRSKVRDWQDGHLPMKFSDALRLLVTATEKAKGNLTAAGKELLKVKVKPKE